MSEGMRHKCTILSVYNPPIHALKLTVIYSSEAYYELVKLTNKHQDYG